MLWTKAVIETMRDQPSEADVIGHPLLVRGGFIRKVGPGSYSYLPLGFRVLCKLEQVVREEMNRVDALEVRLPSVAPVENRPASGGMAGLIGKMLHSYRQLPLRLYQIYTRIPDERRRSRMLARESVAVETYAFDRDRAQARISGDLLGQACGRIFERCGLTVRALTEPEASSADGDTDWVVSHPTGEEILLTCGRCGYTALKEKARAGISNGPWSDGEPEQPLTLVATPGRHTVAEISDYLRVPETRIAKTMLYDADGRIVAVVIRGDREVNETKLRNALAAGELKLATPVQIQAVTNAPVGFAGPFGLAAGVEVWLDDSLAGARNLVTGGNRAETHAQGVNPGRDFQPGRTVDLKSVRAGDACPACASVLSEEPGMLLGRASLAPSADRNQPALFLDEKGEERESVMGNCGLDLSRVLAAVVEQNHDPDGIRWPLGLAPFDILLVPIAPQDPATAGLTASVYRELREAGWDVLWDDRVERPGVKFKDADLIGVPWRLTFGQAAAENKVELKRRDTGARETVSRAEIAARIRTLRQEITRGSACTLES